MFCGDWSIIPAMTVVEDFDDFASQAKILLDSNPEKTRLVSKYNNSEQKLVLKVTDDRVCLMYKTDQESDLKKSEKLYCWYFAHMAGRGADAIADNEVEAAVAVPAVSSSVSKSKKKGKRGKR